MISVAMTTYNGEEFIEKQLLSILNQTRKPDEVIIIDDFSTDNTVEIVTEFIKSNDLSNWKLIKQTTNRGFIYSFNQAISKTNGDIIFLCDHDDIWLHTKIEIMTELMIANPQILSLASGFQKIDADDKEIVSRNIPFSSNNNLIRKRIKPNKCVKISISRIVAYNISPGCTCAFRSSIKDAFGKLNDESMNLVHDWKINIIAAFMGGLYFLNTPTILYRLHKKNALGMSRYKTIESRIQACRKSSIEREFMKKIIKKLIDQNKLQNSRKNTQVYKYISKYQESKLEIEKALQKRSILHCFYILFKYNLFKNRVFESLIVDILSIINSYRYRRYK